MCIQWGQRCAVCLAAAVVFFGVWITAAPARAEPQGSSGLTVGGAAIGQQGQFWDDAAFHLGARGDVLFGRERGSDAAYGPYVELGTLDFSRLELGGGASVLAPVHEDLPLVFSIGGLAGIDGDGAHPLGSASLFWGSRSYNYHSRYGMAAGLFVSARQGLSAPYETSLLIAAQLDFVALSLPVVALANWISGPTESGK